MVRQRRKFKPRARTTRSLDLDNVGLDETQKIQPPTAFGDLWKILPPLSTRLYEKSALGHRLEDGSIALTASEVLFCHWHRHVPLPNASWLESELEKNPRLIYEAIILDVGRNGGEMIVPSTHRPHLEHLSWAVRWHRDRNHLKDDHQSSVSIATTHDALDWNDLLIWCRQSQKMNIDSELFVIDDELDVTMYKIDLINPSGDLVSWGGLSESDKTNFLNQWNDRTPTESGSYVGLQTPWNWQQIGVEHMSGRVLRKEEDSFIEQIIVENATFRRISLMNDS